MHDQCNISFRGVVYDNACRITPINYAPNQSEGRNRETFIFERVERDEPLHPLSNSSHYQIKGSHFSPRVAYLAYFTQFACFAETETGRETKVAIITRERNQLSFCSQHAIVVPLNDQAKHFSELSSRCAIGIAIATPIKDVQLAFSLDALRDTPESHVITWSLTDE